MCTFKLLFRIFFCVCLSLSVFACGAIDDFIQPDDSNPTPALSFSGTLNSANGFGSQIVRSENFTVLVKTSPLHLQNNISNSSTRIYDRFFETEMQTLLEGKQNE